MPMNRRTLLSGACAAAATTLAAAAGPAPAHAAATSNEAPRAGIIRRRIGAIEVTALLDGYLDVDPKLIVGLEPDRADALARAAFQAPGTRQIPVSAYLLDTAGKRILIDAGSAATMGPTLGQMPAALQALGVAPEEIDILAITHLHPDHVNGALRPDGSALFPNAEMVVSEADHRFWHDDGSMNQAGEKAKGFFLGARKGVAAYRDRLRLVADDAEIVPGLRAQLLPGHTPGHSGYRIDHGAESLLIWGDVAHVAAYQFAEPEWGIAFDADIDLARQTRLRAFDQTATDRIMIAGMHLPFPGFGHVVRDGNGYRFQPAEWQYGV